MENPCAGESASRGLNHGSHSLTEKQPSLIVNDDAIGFLMACEQGTKIGNQRVVRRAACGSIGPGHDPADETFRIK